MKLDFLYHLALFFEKHSMVRSFRRIEDNIFKIQLDDMTCYLDFQKSRSSVFMSSEEIQGKSYQAPFDLMLLKCVTHSKIISCKLDGNNRILIFHLLQQMSYKKLEFYLHLEFTGKHTNVILVDHNGCVIEALRHLNATRSSRVVKTGVILTPLAQREIAFNPPPYDQEALIKNLYQNYEVILKNQFREKKFSLLATFNRRLDRLREALALLKSPEKLQEEALRLSYHATLLLTHLHEIKPYAKKVSLMDFENHLVVIKMPDGCRNPQEAINKMFSQSKKLSQKAKGIHRERQNLEDKINFLEREINFILETQKFDHLLMLKTEKNKKESSKVCEVFYIQGYKISIGRNQNENQMLLENAKANDIWMHICNLPSSHLIIHCGKNYPPFDVINRAGEILVGICSKTRNGGSFRVDYTLRKFVRIKEKSFVNYAKYQTLNYRV